MKDSTLDYLACILFNVLSSLFRVLPVGLVFFIGRRLGDLVYVLDLKHRPQVRANIRQALSGRLTCREIRRLTRKFYRGLGQSVIEVFLIPSIDKKYIDKYVTLDGLENIYQGFKNGRGVIFMVVHEGSWELSNIVSSLQGFPFSVIVRDQGMKRLNDILNDYRRQKGAKTIDREFQLQEVVRVLKNNEAVAMTIDQGGADGMHVRFFGKDASMATGAIRLALKYGCVLLPVFFSRIKGPVSRITIKPAMQLQVTGDLASDLQVNLQQAMKIFEGFIEDKPEEYLWTYKIWKHGLERDILVLWDGRTGHLRQAQAAAQELAGLLKERNIRTAIETVEVRKPDKEAYDRLMKLKPDFIISCGSSVGRLNYALSRENNAKSVIIMRPPLMSTDKFDLVIIPRHDNPHCRPNVMITEGALNLIDEDYLKAQAVKLNIPPGRFIGLLLGGDSRKFRLSEDKVRQICRQLKRAAQELKAEVLVSTSRRTPAGIERLVKAEFGEHPGCRLMIIANEKNVPETVGGILSLSSVVIISPESISMVSEAASSGRRVIVFKEKGLSGKHGRFLKSLALNNYIVLSDAGELTDKIFAVWESESRFNRLDDRKIVREALRKII